MKEKTGIITRESLRGDFLTHWKRQNGVCVEIHAGVIYFYLTLSLILKSHSKFYQTIGSFSSINPKTLAKQCV